MTVGRLGTRVALTSLATFALIGSTACFDRGRAQTVPTELLDGTPVRSPPVDLEGIGDPAVLTLVKVASLENGGERTGSCHEIWGGRPLAPTAVERVGVWTESVTLRERSGRALLGCDNAEGPREDDRRWCGAAHGVLHEGELRDPRLDILCRAAEGAALGFAWIEPSLDAKYVAVSLPGFVEVYETAGRVPVRISTLDVDVERSTAAFDVSEHDVAGQLLRRYRLEAVVAG